jgi:putative tricarboxylic transport membrane protein
VLTGRQSLASLGPRCHMAALLTLLACAPAAFAEPQYQHLRLVAPAAPGGGWDQTARAMQQALQAAGIVGTSSVENIPGAAGTIALARLISAERGNSDVLMVSGLIMLGGVVTHLSPVTLRDVTPIARLVGEYEVIVVPAGSPYQTLRDLLEAFRQHPEAISWGGGSAGGTDQILAGLLADAIGVEPRRVNYIAFAGGGESLSAILGGQVTVGISGLAEFAPHIAARTMRVLAISSAERLGELDAPTLREQGVDVVLENWRSLIAPPGLSDADRQRLTSVVDAMVRSPAWRDTLVRYRWTDRYLAGDQFVQFTIDEEARVHSILAKLGTGARGHATSGSTTGPYPMFVLAGLALTALAFVVDSARRRRAQGNDGRTTDLAMPEVAGRRALAWIGVAIVLNAALLEGAGFIVASIPLFWLTARAFDARHPKRDAAFAVVFSAGTYFVFARLLQIALPPGIFARWL